MSETRATLTGGEVMDARGTACPGPLLEAKQAMPATPTEIDVQRAIEQLTARVDALEQSAGNGRLSIGVMSGNLDTTMAAFIIALGAAAYDMEVDMFFTFWATAALRDSRKSPAKGFLDRMFGWMLPRSSSALPLSKMQMAGIWAPDDSLGDEATRREIPGGVDERCGPVWGAHSRLRNVDGRDGAETRRNDRLPGHRLGGGG